jgi:hypothetical protein
MNKPIDYPQGFRKKMVRTKTWYRNTGSGSNIYTGNGKSHMPRKCQCINAKKLCLG